MYEYTVVNTGSKRNILVTKSRIAEPGDGIKEGETETNQLRKGGEKE